MAEGSDKIEKLTGADNWEIWKFMIQCILGEKEHALEVVTGDLLLPDGAGVAGVPPNAVGLAALPAEQRAIATNYIRGNRTAMAILTRFINPKVLVSLMACATARQMWERLIEIYERDTALGGVALQSEFCEFNQDEGETLTELIHRFDNLLYRMNAKGIAPNDGFQIARLMSALRGDYRAFRQGWNARPAAAQSMVELQGCLITEDECQQRELKLNQPLQTGVTKPTNGNGNGKGAGVKGEAHLSTGSGRSYRPKNADGPTNPAGPSIRPGDSNVEPGQTRYSAATKLVCFYCQIPGHLKRDCRKFQADTRNGTVKQPQPKSGQAHVAGPLSVDDPIALPSTEPEPGFGFVCAAALQVSSSGRDSGWYIDSGASFHMTNDKRLLTDYQPFADGQTSKIVVGSGEPVEGYGRGHLKVRSKIGN